MGEAVEVVRTLLSLRDVGERWHISVKSIRRMIWKNELKAVRLGGVLRVPIDEVKRYERSRPVA